MPVVDYNRTIHWSAIQTELISTGIRTMQRFFNTAGPINAEIQQQIAQRKYFVLHAPRQTGKTSTLLAIVEAFNQSLYANVKGAQRPRNDTNEGIQFVWNHRP